MPIKSSTITDIFYYRHWHSFYDRLLKKLCTSYACKKRSLDHHFRHYKTILWKLNLQLSPVPLEAKRVHGSNDRVIGNLVSRAHQWHNTKTLDSNLAQKLFLPNDFSCIITQLKNYSVTPSFRYMIQFYDSVWNYTLIML